MVKAFVAKGTLLPQNILEGLAESKSLDDLVVKLKGTIYNEAVSRLQPPYTPRSLEAAFREHLAYIHFRLTQTTPKAELLSAYYLKYISGNLKMVLKGKAQDRPYEEIAGHIDLYAEELLGRRDLIIRALSAQDLKQAVEVFEGSEFASDAESALKVIGETSRYQVFDVYIDRAFYNKVLEAFIREAEDDRWVRDIVAVDIDSYNTLAVLRGKLWNLSPPDIRGLIIEPTFSVKDAETLSEGLKCLTGTTYRTLIPQVDGEEAALAALEDAFQILTYKRALKPFIWDIQGMSVVLGLVKLKELEVRNLSAIAFGVAQHLGLKDIASRLTMLR